MFTFWDYWWTQTFPPQVSTGRCISSMVCWVMTQIWCIMTFKSIYFFLSLWNFKLHHPGSPKEGLFTWVDVCVFIRPHITQSVFSSNKNKWNSSSKQSQPQGTKRFWRTDRVAQKQKLELFKGSPCVAQTQPSSLCFRAFSIGQFCHNLCNPIFFETEEEEGNPSLHKPEPRH